MCSEFKTSLPFWDTFSTHLITDEYRDRLRKNKVKRTAVITNRCEFVFAENNNIFEIDRAVAETPWRPDDLFSTAGRRSPFFR